MPAILSTISFCPVIYYLHHTPNSSATSTMTTAPIVNISAACRSRFRRQLIPVLAEMLMLGLGPRSNGVILVNEVTQQDSRAFHCNPCMPFLGILALKSYT
jgi:hypothetical protein